MDMLAQEANQFKGENKTNKKTEQKRIFRLGTGIFMKENENSVEADIWPGETKKKKAK